MAVVSRIRVRPRYHQQPLLSTVDPKVFVSPTKFVHGGVNTELIRYNGQSIKPGSGNDYEAFESGGVGTGYDTIELLFDPRPESNWEIDLVPFEL